MPLVSTPIALCVLFILSISAYAQQSLELEPVADNTMYSDSGGPWSNGAGQNLFAGRNRQSNLRRALIRFDPAGSLPEGAIIDSVIFSLRATKGRGSTELSIHRLLSDWGEGASDAGGSEGRGAPAMADDVTWQSRIFNATPWATPGGDFRSALSAKKSASGPGRIVWPSTPEIVNDVGHWIAQPDSNFGWIVIGDEETDQSAYRFSSRENPTVANRPTLRLVYSVATARETVDLPGNLVIDGVYPNPFTSTVTVHYTSSDAEAVTINVFDLLGREVLNTVVATGAPGARMEQLELGGVSSGFFFVRIQSRTGSRYASIMKTGE